MTQKYAHLIPGEASKKAVSHAQRDQPMIERVQAARLATTRSRKHVVLDLRRHHEVDVWCNWHQLRGR